MPARCAKLASALYHSLSRSTTASESPSRPLRLDSDSLKRAWRLARDSPVLVIGAVFPSTIREGQDLFTSSLQSHNFLLAGRALSPLGLTRHEARSKRRQLLKQRDALATRLGLLAQKMDSVPQEAEESPSALLQELQRRIIDMQQALNAQTTAVSADPDVASRHIASSLETILSQYVDAQQDEINAVLSSSPKGNGPPSAMARLWPTIVLVPVTTIIVVRVVTASWDTIVEKAVEVQETMKGFAINWVYEPCLKLLDTIRTGDQEGVITSKESLNSDLQSLERMVTEFSAEKYGLRGAELDNVTQRVREGDLTTVLKIYESELKVCRSCFVWLSGAYSSAPCSLHGLFTCFSSSLSHRSSRPSVDRSYAPSSYRSKR
jgi:nuclear-control-of-ATPase protein 2